MQKTFWQSQNFWITLLVGVVGGFFVLYPGEAITQGIVSLFTVVYAGAMVSDWVRSKEKPDVKKALTDANWWNYVGGLVIMWWDKLPIEFFDQAGEVVTQILGGNYQGALVGAFGLLSILYHVFIKKRIPEAIKAAKSLWLLAPALGLSLAGNVYQATAKAEPTVIEESADEDFLSRVTWEVQVSWKIEYKLNTNGPFPDAYTVTVMHLDFPRELKQPLRPSVKDVTWQPDLSGFDKVQSVSIAKIFVKQTGGKRLEIPVKAEPPAPTE